MLARTLNAKILERREISLRVSLIFSIWYFPWRYLPICKYLQFKPQAVAQIKENSTSGKWSNRNQPYLTPLKKQKIQEMTFKTLDTRQQRTIIPERCGTNKFYCTETVTLVQKAVTISELINCYNMKGEEYFNFNFLL